MLSFILNLLSWLTIRAGRESVGWSRLHRTHKSSRQYVPVGCSRSSSLRVLANMYLLTVSGSLTRKIQTTLRGAEATGHQSSYKRLHHIYTCCEGRSTGDTVGWFTFHRPRAGPGFGMGAHGDLMGPHPQLMRDAPLILVPSTSRSEGIIRPISYTNHCVTTVPKNIYWI